MNQQDLWSVPPEAPVRRGDPVTSKNAAKTVNVTRGRAQVLEVLRSLRCATDEELTAEVKRRGIVLSDSGIRTRRAELCDAGYVVASGEYGVTKSGRKSIIWQVTSQGLMAS